MTPRPRLVTPRPRLDLVDNSPLLRRYLRAAMLNLQVDHYYPMRGKRVCGLHVADNLRIVTGLENMRKGSDSPDAGSNY